MSERWVMHRLGFVNFWLYDDASFPLADGKLFLRGDNGSGKSITTQSIIPFILDGNRSPERLDPFGSRDRRMEYYFLGDAGEKEEATGYIYLEFKKGNVYRTIGIGQQARRGRPMDFWGFILKDNRRIGYDISLYERTGDTMIPHSKRKLMNLLGPDNPVTDRQQEYMELVNHALFGFADSRDYDQLIKLLIKVRAPKLSKDFKPTDIYGILNASLPTLAEEDFSTIASAMESLDEYRLRLDGQEKALEDARALCAVYDRYNRFVLVKKARAAQEAQQRLSEAQKKQRDRKVDIEKAEGQRKDLEGRHLELTQQISAANAQLYAIDISDFEQMANNLENQEKQREEREGQMHKACEEREQKHQSLNAAYDRAQDLKTTLRCEEDVLYKVEKEYVQANEVVQYPAAPDIEGIVEGRVEPLAIDDLRRETADHLKGVGNARNAIAAWEDSRTRLGEQETKTEARSQEEAKARRDEAEARDTQDREREALIQAYQGMALKELPLNDERRHAAVDILIRYQGQEDMTALMGITTAARDEKQKELVNNRADYENKRKKAQDEYSAAKTELERLKKAPLAEPPRREEVAAARAALNKAGIAHQPLYEVLEYAPGVSEAEQAILEAQITDLGLLDALVVAGEDRMRANQILTDQADRILIPAMHRRDSDLPDARFVPGGVQPALRDALDDVLKAIGAGDDAAILLSPDGKSRHGNLWCCSLPLQGPGFIGVAARKRRQAEAIAAQAEAVASLEAQVRHFTTRRDESTERLKCLDREYESLPKTQDLDTAISLVREAGLLAKQAAERLHEQEAELQKALRREQDDHRKMQQSCAAYAYEKTTSAYEEVLASGMSLVDALEELYRKANDYKLHRQDQTRAQERFEELESDLETIDARISEAKRNLAVIAQTIEAIKNQLDDPEIRRKAEEVRRLKADVSRCAEEDSALMETIGGIKTKLARLIADEEEDRPRLAGLEAEAQKRCSYFNEEQALGLIDGYQAEKAEGAQACLGAAAPEDLEMDHAAWTARLSDAYSKRTSRLSEYQAQIVARFDSDPEAIRERRYLEARLEGRRMDFVAFTRLLKDKVEENHLILNQEDEKLFRDMMSDTLCRKLTARIRESRQFIHKMSELMQAMDTSMGLSFDLDWRPGRQADATELSTQELERFLTKSQAVLSDADQKRVTDHFRHKLEQARQRVDEQGEVVNYADLIRETLDYRTWYTFRMNIRREGEGRKELTNSEFNRMSGGEKAMAMYVPLFAAVNAQYAKAGYGDHPRMIALDEAFAGVDDTNIAMLFRLVGTLDLDYIMNSQALWGCYATVPALHIAELIRPVGQQLVLVVHYTWNGKERRLDG